ncbi:hypothetical protein AHiyo1_37430 [Arthrobacter sp. Hiyo1]|nr:hypothetical protein AHiyo1_37430 [Arthrobacter sp. Hiyo1]
MSVSRSMPSCSKGVGCASRRPATSSVSAATMVEKIPATKASALLIMRDEARGHPYPRCNVPQRNGGKPLLKRYFLGGLGYFGRAFGRRLPRSAFLYGA